MAIGYKSKFEVVTADENLPGKVMLYEKPGRECFTNRHWHKNIEIDFIVHGRMWTNVGGEDRDLFDGDFILVNSEEVHQTCGKDEEEPVKYLVVLFSYSSMKAYFPDFDRYTFDVDKSDQTRPKIRELLKAIVFEAENESELSKLKISTAMNQILIILFSRCKTAKPFSPAEQEDEGDRVIRRALEFIRENYAEPISLDDIASFVGLTPTYFSRYFSNATGNTFKGYLNLVRLENTLLDIQQFSENETKASLTNGFPSVKSFISTFKSVYGCAPSEYVKRYHEEPAVSQIRKQLEKQ